MAEKKTTSAEVALRVDEVYRIRLDGAQFPEIREYAVKMGWGVSDSMIRKYIQKANELLRERRERARGTLFALHLARGEALYARALQAADYRTALACLQDMAKANRLYPDDKGLVKQVAELLKRLASLEGDSGPTEDAGPGTRPAGHPGPQAGGDSGGEPLREVPH